MEISATLVIILALSIMISMVWCGMIIFRRAWNNTKDDDFKSGGHH